MKDSPRWGSFKKLWMERIDIEHAKAARAASLVKTAGHSTKEA